MLQIAEELAKNFAGMVLTVALELAVEAHKYIESHDHIWSFTKYPQKHDIFDRNDPNFTEFFETIPYLQYDIPKYYAASYSENCIDYNGIFSGFTKDCVKCEELTSFKDLGVFAQNEMELQKVLTRGGKRGDIFTVLKKIIQDCVIRYLFLTHASGNIPENLEDQLIDIIDEKLMYYFANNLEIQIYVPICLVTFEEDSINLADGIDIVRIPEEVQKARQYECRYEVNKEDWVAACATHMIVLDNYSYNNIGDYSINSSTRDYNSYPLQIIDNIMATIRIITGASLGYQQILTRPVGWFDNFSADLITLYGAKAHFVNPNELKKMWMELPVTYIDNDQCERIRQLYKHVRESEEQNYTKILFALKRFNRCNLRNEIDDMATDATIGLEALLSGGTKGEITYTMSNRIPIVFSKIRNELYTPLNCRNIMKKIYALRSKIVHGGELKEKDKTMDIDGERFNLHDIAVEFLRYTLLFMLENPKYLDTSKIEEEIDRLLQENQRIFALM